MTLELGLDKPMGERYFSLIAGYFQGELGNSIKFQEPIADIFSSRLPTTVSLGIFSLILIILFTLPLGLIAGSHYNTTLGRVIIFISNIFTAIPSYFLSIIITIVFGLILKFFQSGSFV